MSDAEEYAEFMAGVADLTRAELVELLETSIKSGLWDQRIKRDLRAEVERLKVELAETIEHREIAEQEEDRAKAEVERLREALRRAADEPSIDRARAIADEALK